MQEGHDEKRRQDDDEGAGQCDVPVRRAVIGGQKRAERHHHRLVGRVGDHQERPEILVPGINEHDGGERQHVGARQRQQHVHEETRGTRTVHARGLRQLVRYRHEELPIEKGAGGGGDQWQSEAGIGVEEVPFQRDLDAEQTENRAERLEKIGGDRIGRHHAHFERQHQGDKHRPEEQVFERRAEEHDGKGGEGRKGDLSDGDQRRHDDAVEEGVAEIGALPGSLRIGEEFALRHEAEGDAVDLLDRLAGAGNNDDEGADKQEEAGRHDRIGQGVGVRGALDHGRLTCNGLAARQSGTG
ncbi:hypothetical protein D3C87_767500 [compost metagenome]